MPQRIQRRRTKGWRMPAGAKYVGRPTKWGNPWTVRDWYVIGPGLPDLEFPGGTAARCRAAALYRAWLTNHWTTNLTWDLADRWTTPQLSEHRRRILDNLLELRGHDLACWCPLPEPGKPDHCHAAVLLALANPRPVITPGPSGCTTCGHPWHDHMFRPCNGVVHDEHGPLRWPCPCPGFTKRDPS